MSGIGEATIAELRYAFQACDKENKGYLQRKELLTVLQSIGFNPSQVEVDELISEVDTSHKGQITLEEFISLCNKKSKIPTQDIYLQHAFNVFDKRQQGSIFFFVFFLLFFLLCLYSLLCMYAFHNKHNAKQHKIKNEKSHIVMVFELRFSAVCVCVATE